MRRKFAHLWLCSAQHNTDVKERYQHKLYMKTSPTASLHIAAGKAEEAIHGLKPKLTLWINQNYSLRHKAYQKAKMFRHVQTTIKWIKYILWQFWGEALQIVNEWIVDWSFIWMSKLIMLGVKWLTHRSVGSGHVTQGWTCKSQVVSGHH